MKKLLIILILLPLAVQSQDKGYAFLQPSFFIKRNYTNQFNLNGGVGFRLGDYIGLGISLDAYVFKKAADPFIIPKADFRGFLFPKDKNVLPFLAFQPGYVVYKQTVQRVTTKGAAAFDALIGVLAKPPKGGIGFTMSMGYSSFGFSAPGVSIRYNGFKVQAGVAF